MGDVLQRPAGRLGADLDEGEFTRRLIAEQLDGGGHHEFAENRAEGRGGEEICLLVLADPPEISTAGPMAL